MTRLLGTALAVMAGIVFGRLLSVWLSPRLAPENVGERHPMRRLPLAELAVGAIWGVLAWRLTDLLIVAKTGAGFELPRFNLEYTAGIMIFCGALVGIALLDTVSFNLSDYVTLPGVAIGVVFYALTSEQMVWYFVTESTPWREIGARLLSVVCAGALVLLIRWGYWLLRRREILGWGEAHLMAMLAAWLGLPGALLAFSIGALIGTMILFLLWAAHPILRRSEERILPKLPVGALVCAGGVISCLWGAQIVSTYLHWSNLPRLALRLP